MNRRTAAATAASLLLALTLNAWGGDIIKINAPGILDKPGATYVLTKDVTAQRTAFMIKGDGITLDLGEHTVTYGAAVGVDRCSGVFLRPAGGEEPFTGARKDGFGGGDRFTLQNGRIVQGPQPLADKLTSRDGRMIAATGPTPGRSCMAVYVRACRGLEIRNVTTEVNSRDTDNLYIRECEEVRIHDNHCLSQVREITNRHWPGTGVITVAGVRGPTAIHHNVIDGGGQWGIRVSGGDELTGPLAQVHHNIIRHRSYTTNGYAIGAAAPNMRIFANVIQPVAGRGIHLSGRGVDCYNNIVDVREKPNPEYPRTRAHGVKLEGCRHTLVHHNFIRSVAAKGFGDAAPLDFSVETFSANRVYKNTVVAQRESDATEFWAASVNLYSVQPRSLTQVHDNVFKTNDCHVRFDWGGASDFVFTGNRFETIGDAQDYRFWLFQQSLRAESRNIAFLDNQAVGLADLRKLSPLRPGIPRQGLNVRIRWTVTVKAVDPASKGVGGVLISAREHGEQVAVAISDDSGKAQLALLDYRIVGDRENPIEEHGPYEILARSGGQVVSSTTVDPSAPTTVTVAVTGPDRKLYVNAGEDQRRQIGETATLNGKVVAIGGAGEPEIAWKRVSGSDDSPILNASSARAQVVMSKWGECVFELSARLGDETARDRVKVRADARLTPIAVARAPATAKPRTIVQLDAAGSTDPRGFPKSRIRYAWRQVEGPPAILSSDQWPTPIFHPVEAGEYVFELTVSNPLRTSRPARCAVTVLER